MKERNGVLLLSCAVAAILCLFPGSADARDYRWTGGDCTVSDDATKLTLAGSGSGVITIPLKVTALTIDGQGLAFADTCVRISPGHRGLTLTIKKLRIMAPKGDPGIDFAAGDDKLLLEGDSAVMGGGGTLFGDGGCAGVRVPKGAALTIDSAAGGGAPDGTLTVSGAGGSNGGGSGAGIGGNGGNGGYRGKPGEDSGHIAILGGTIVAEGGIDGESGGAGIGGGGGGYGDRLGGDGGDGSVTIRGGSIVATGGRGNCDGSGGAGIGGGGGGNARESGNGGNGGNSIVTIEGGNVAATGGRVDCSGGGGAAIGSGGYGFGGCENGKFGVGLLVDGSNNAVCRLKVTITRNGQPVSNAKVTAGNYTALTDSAGKACCYLPAGKTFVRAAKGALSARGSVEVTANDAAALALELATPAIRC